MCRLKTVTYNIVDDLSNNAAGTTYSVAAINQQMRRIGFYAKILSTDKVSNVVNESEDHIIFPRLLPNAPVMNELKVSPELSSYLANVDFDLLHIHGLWGWPTNAAATVASRRKKKLILSTHGMIGKEVLKISYFKKKLALFLYQNRTIAAADCIHVTSEQEYLEVREFGVKLPVALIPHGIDIPDIDRSADPAKDSNLYVLSLGRIHPKKRLDSLILAWAKVSQDLPNWKLRIVGPDDVGHAGDLIRIINNLNLSSVTIEDAVFGDQKRSIISGAGLFVVSSANENFGFTIAESLSLGVPVITTKNTPWSGVKTNRCGWWVDGDVDSLCEALSNALGLEQTVRREMGLRGRDWMENEFSWCNKGDQMGEVYSWLLGVGKLPSCVRLE